MNELILIMSEDMGINRFSGETEESFTYRVLFSALGQWCLRTADSISAGNHGTTKHNQTIVLNDLINKYSKIFPTSSDRFLSMGNQHINLPVFIRRVYEETGYLLTDKDNRNKIANYGRSIMLGGKSLFFGLPWSDYTVNGFGVFTDPTNYRVSAKDFLIRDNLTYEEYFNSRFDPIDYYDRHIDVNELEFFNPLSRNVPSRSWEKQPQTDCTLARKSELGPFYRVMRISDELQFADEPVEPQSDKLTSYEYRRLYFALKAHYGAPLKATITKLDDEYSMIRVGGHLPNREYYYLLLLSWPVNDAFDKVNYLAHNDLVEEIIDTLKNIGVEIEGGANNE
ncbi:MAG: hypothetical protein BI182_10825 [Acetobacterium sp. MES1]|uniref:hypothetical protein n=1 Tax=Acetobacterium sp. MES1 TaxID=1899015 RepID=UPI000B9D24C5|nr:hypothetical protein [Acetobacterium sp. MES1]OXS27174.1 MAG: hypothetical protein BI182_10825 [Acetobacterium sp. MES1]